MSEPPRDFDDRARRAAEEVRAGAGHLLHKWWLWILVRGLLLVLVGLIALFWPTGSFATLLRIVGLLLLVDGVTALLAGRGGGDRRALTASGIASLVVGVVLLVVPGASARLAFTLIGLWALLAGANHLWSWWRAPANAPERDTTRAVGLVAAAAGLVLIFWPATGMVALGWVLAVVALVVGAAMLYLAARLKRLETRIR